MPEPISRDLLAERYLTQLPYTPYPFQEDAILTWFTAKQGALICAPTGTGKTLIAEAALFEALHSGTTAYYTTPLIALTEQKFAEMQSAAVRWGFSPDDVGLVTGNRQVNPRARVLVVVAEILLNRLLNPTMFDFSNVGAVVMDEFHSFNDPQRGIVWELSLSMLPRHVRLLLLSATVGNAMDFLMWLDRAHGRRVEFVESTHRRVPLTYLWVEDELLNEQVTNMAKGAPAERLTPALVFCFNRDECWSVAEQLKGCQLLDDHQRTRLMAEVNALDWSEGVGPKLKQLLMRGVGVHHAGVLPKYRRMVEQLFTQKLLAVTLCTETLAAGINLPARSVVLTSLVKGPLGKQKLLDPSTAQQIFGRAGRPQFDDRGFVVAMAHEDDVRILRWKQKYDSIPEDTKDPGLMKAKKALKKKKPTRRENQQYWNEPQFEKLQTAPPTKLSSKGELPWRLLAYLLQHSPDVEPLRRVVRKRFMEPSRLEAAEDRLHRMLRVLHDGGFVTLEPEPPPHKKESSAADKAEAAPQLTGLAALLAQHVPQSVKVIGPAGVSGSSEAPPAYIPEIARPTGKLARLLLFRSVNPLYGAFLLKQLGLADRSERIQALESVLELPRPLLRFARVPRDMPSGPLASQRLDPELVSRGLIAAPRSETGDDEDDDMGEFEEEFGRPPTLAEKLRLLFDALHPGAGEFTTQGIWVAGELLELAGKFNTFVKSRDLVKQEGLIFRHLLRLILMCGEFSEAPLELAPGETDWKADLREVAEALTASCREVDPTSTDEAMQLAHAADVVEGETHTLPK